jgi:hypothetical protein
VIKQGDYTKTTHNVKTIAHLSEISLLCKEDDKTPFISQNPLNLAHSPGKQDAPIISISQQTRQGGNREKEFFCGEHPARRQNAKKDYRININ